jgi:CIC family chloride channel protein
VRLRPTLARAVSSIAVISSGGSEGREGPIIQIGAACASAISRRWKVSPERVRILTACGMAAGVAGAYNTPIAATLFVLEVVVGSFSMALFGPAVVSAVCRRCWCGRSWGAPVYRSRRFAAVAAGGVSYAVIGILGGARRPLSCAPPAGKKVFAATRLPSGRRSRRRDVTDHDRLQVMERL